jgi:hypothetical protein
VLSISASRDFAEYTDAAIAAGETLADMASYWSEALPEERRDIVWALLKLNGLVYDLERQAIVGLVTREDLLPVLFLGLGNHWEQRDEGLWILDEYLPMQYKLDHLQRQQVREMARLGMTVRQLAIHFGVPRMAIWRTLRVDDERND